MGGKEMKLHFYHLHKDYKSGGYSVEHQVAEARESPQQYNLLRKNSAESPTFYYGSYVRKDMIGVTAKGELVVLLEEDPDKAVELLAQKYTELYESCMEKANHYKRIAHALWELKEKK
jgi:hypothetical protein